MSKLWEPHVGVSLLSPKLIRARVDIYIRDTDCHQHVVMAERADNPSLSITQAYASYAMQICQLFFLNPDNCIFYELYVIPNQLHGQLTKEYTFNICHLQPSILSSTHLPLAHHLGPDPMSRHILNTLLAEQDPTYSYPLIRNQD